MPSRASGAASHDLAALFQILGLQDDAPTLRGTVLLCVDCEAFEFDQSKVTEVGVAVLDTKDIRGIPAGDNAADWISKMRYAHYVS